MVVNLQKLSDADRLELCRRYFYGGFAFLPLLWLINFIWFYKYAYGVTQTADENLARKKLKFYVCWSAVGSAVWFAVLAGWVLFYQLHQRSGQIDWVEKLTYIFPMGYV